MPMSVPSLSSPKSTFLRVVAACCALAAASTAGAQTAGAVSTVFAFNGSTPSSYVIVGADGNYYGTSIANTSVSGGLVFSTTPDGGTVRSLHQFVADEGSTPRSGLLRGGDGYFYGTTRFGSAYVVNSSGTVFRIKEDGTGFEILHRFTDWEEVTANGAPINRQGVYPESPLILASDDYLYGVTRTGGEGGTGAIFRIRRDGSEFSAIHEFGPVTSEVNAAPQINVGGSSPNGRLLEMPDGYLYGTAAGGGINGRGTIFRIRLDGTGFEVVYEFEDIPDVSPYENFGGITPLVGLIDGEDGYMYGTASSGGDNAVGTLFAIDTTTLEFQVRHDFDAPKGAGPAGELLIGRDGRLYGTTAGGGTNSSGSTVALGTIFSIERDGTDFQSLHTFTGDNGYGPAGALVQVDDTTFIGIATLGGKCNQGTVYQFSTTGQTIEGDKTCGQKKKKQSGGGDGGAGVVLLLAALAVARRRIGA
jgi:uncharacterized repeat protein (TIGR03803 family)